MYVLLTSSSTGDTQASFLHYIKVYYYNHPIINLRFWQILSIGNSSTQACFQFMTKFLWVLPTAQRQAKFWAS